MAGRQNRDVVVVGASSGGLEALRILLADLPAPLGAAVFIVQHRHAQSGRLLSDLLGPVARLPVEPAEDGRPIEPDHVVVAPPDQHLVVERDRVRLSQGPRENLARPAIDVLFRSAAVTFGARTIGAVLTGQLNDGAAGLHAIARCGGMTAVQDPRDALYPEMPAAALATARPDHCVPLAELGGLIGRLAGEPAGPQPQVPEELRLEARMATFEALGPEVERRIGQASGLSCPDCEGPLWELPKSGPVRFRCSVGHAFTAEAVLQQQEREVERAMWVALRVLRERSALARRAADEEESRGRSGIARMWTERANEAEGHARTLVEALMRSAAAPGEPAWSSRTGAIGEGRRSPDGGATAAPDPG